MVLKSSSVFGPNKAMLHACFLCNMREKNIYDSAKKWNFFVIEILALRLEKWLLIDCWKMRSTHLPTAQTSVVNGNAGCSDGDYLCTGGAFVRAVNGEGKRLGCPESDVYTRHLDETPPSSQCCLTLTTFSLEVSARVICRSTSSEVLSWTFSKLCVQGQHFSLLL